MAVSSLRASMKLNSDALEVAWAAHSAAYTCNKNGLEQLAAGIEAYIEAKRDMDRLIRQKAAKRRRKVSQRASV